jgi:hypothetical protein
MAEYKAFSGLRNDVPSERWFEVSKSGKRSESGDLVTADNVDIDASGQLSRRAGRTLAVAGDYHSLWSEGALCLMVGGTSLLRVKPGYTTEALRTGLTAGARMAYCPVNERTYYSNGRETGVVEAGVSRSWGLANPAHQGTASAVSGSLPAGTYQWAVTFLRDDGQESGTGLAGRIDVGDDAGITFADLPVSADPAVVGKILYLTECNGSVLYEAATLAAAVTTHTVTAPGPAANPIQTQHLSSPPAGHLIAYFRGRMWVAVGNLVYYSEPHAYELFDLRHYLDFPGPVTLMAPVESAEGGGMVIAAGEMTGWLSGTSPEEATFTLLADYGALLGALDYVEGTLFGDGSLGGKMLPMWASTAGICTATPDGQLLNLTEQRFTMDEAGEGCAVFMPDEARYVVVINH